MNKISVESEMRGEKGMQDTFLGEGNANVRIFVFLFLFVPCFIFQIANVGNNFFCFKFIRPSIPLFLK
jgi:hypothetical protein